MDFDRQLLDPPEQAGRQINGGANTARSETVEPLGFQLNVAEEKSAYWRIADDEQLSNFAMRSIEQIKSADDIKITVEFLPQAGLPLRRTVSTRIFSSLGRFKQELCKHDLQFSFRGSQQDFEDIKLLLARQTCTVRHEVGFVGIHQVEGSPIFVAQHSAIDARGERCPELVMSQTAVNVQTDLLDFTPITKEELAVLGPALFGYNALPVTATIGGFIGSCFLKPSLQAAGIKTGELILVGESGSGKSTTLEELIQPIFASKNAIAAHDLTEASLRHAVASSNAIPTFLEEYKPAKLTKEKNAIICNTLRNAYDGHLTQHGNANGAVTQTVLRSPIVLTGEAAPGESAIRERCLMAQFDKLTLSQHPEYTAHMAVLKKNSVLLSKLGRMLLQTAMNLDANVLREYHAELMASVPENVACWPQRIRQNYVTAMLGLDLIDQVCTAHGLSLETLSGCKAADLEEALQTAIREYLLSGSDHNPSVVDESLASMLSRMELVPGKDYRYFDNYGEIAVDINGIFDRFVRFVRQNKIDCDLLPLEQLKQQLQKHAYYRRSKPVKVGGQNKRMLTLDVAALEKCIGDILPAKPMVGAA